MHVMQRATAERLTNQHWHYHFCPWRHGKCNISAHAGAHSWQQLRLRIVATSIDYHWHGNAGKQINHWGGNLRVRHLWAVATWLHLYAHTRTCNTRNMRVCRQYALRISRFRYYSRCCRLLLQRICTKCWRLFVVIALASSLAKWDIECVVALKSVDWQVSVGLINMIYVIGLSALAPHIWSDFQQFCSRLI